MKMRVIARCYGDEPRELVEIHREHGRAYLLGPSRADADDYREAGAVAFPLSHVFPHDADAFKRLRHAYESGDQEGLLQEWQALCQFRAEAAFT